ncbi:PLC-like phosphodiesterase [Mycena rosella]|uniref:Phosphoinositide phospholipase C n=1 Tax=Mycena rosella TaxID=1033263 RepID=A0AAD7DV46_MYCRO|nr:PLC-like phosphodiesterase [Mycena rosella]
MTTDFSKVVGYELAARPATSTLTTFGDSSSSSRPDRTLTGYNPAFVDCVEKTPHEERHHHPHHPTSPVKDEDGASGGGHDMTRPLRILHLLVAQHLVGESTVEGHVRALQAGCRCVEVYIHPGNPPLMTHGNILTSKLSLRKVCEVIDQYAFVASPYPLIISAEIHCSPAQQDIVVDIMLSVFGDKLGAAGASGMAEGEAGRGVDGGGGDEWEGGEESFCSGSQARAPPSCSAAIQRVRSRSREPSVSASTTTSDSSPPSSYIPLSPCPADSTKTPKMSAALLPLLVYTVGVKYRGINKKEVYAPQPMFSLSETTANKLLQGGVVVKHTRGHLVRMYPKGMRLRSSNYLPHSYWAAGAQLVAINWQTLELGYMINHAMFARNGGSGYVLKPRALRLASQKELLARRTEHMLQPPPPPKDPSAAGGTVDPYVEVSVHVPDWSGFLHPSASTSSPSGTSPSPSLNIIASPSPPTPTSTSASVTYRTSAVKNNGFNPVWEERLRIPFAAVVDMMELVFVRLAVRQDGGGTRRSRWWCIAQVSRVCSKGTDICRCTTRSCRSTSCMFSMLFVKMAVRDL